MAAENYVKIEKESEQKKDIIVMTYQTYVQEAGVLVEEDSNENIFELQHHHLLRCLEKTTVMIIMTKSIKI